MELMETVLVTLVSAIAGTFVGGAVTHKATTKVEEKKRVHEARLAEVQIWSDLRNLTTEEVERITMGTVEEVRRTIGSVSSEGEAHEKANQYYVQEASFATLLLQLKLETACYSTHDSRSERHLKSIIENLKKGIKESGKKESSSEKWSLMNQVFGNLLDELLKGQQFSREMLKYGRSDVLSPDPTGGMYT